MTTLTLDSLKSQGAFTGAPVPKEVTYTGEDGEEHTVTTFVRRLSYLAAVSDVRAAKGEVDGIAGRIASSICDEHGQAVFTPEDITGYYADGSPIMVTDPETGEEKPRGSMNRSLSLALLAAIGEVNPLLGKTKSSRKKKRSGTSSSSTVSEGAPSPKPSNASATSSLSAGSSTAENAEA